MLVTLFQLYFIVNLNKKLCIKFYFFIWHQYLIACSKLAVTIQLATHFTQKSFYDILLENKYNYNKKKIIVNVHDVKLLKKTIKKTLQMLILGNIQYRSHHYRQFNFVFSSFTYNKSYKYYIFYIEYLKKLDIKYLKISM